MDSWYAHNYFRLYVKVIRYLPRGTHYAETQTNMHISVSFALEEAANYMICLSRLKILWP